MNKPMMNLTRKTLNIRNMFIRASGKGIVSLVKDLQLLCRDKH